MEVANGEQEQALVKETHKPCTPGSSDLVRSRLQRLVTMASLRGKANVALCRFSPDCRKRAEDRV